MMVHSLHLQCWVGDLNFLQIPLFSSPIAYLTGNSSLFRLLPGREALLWREVLLEDSHTTTLCHTPVLPTTFCNACPALASPSYMPVVMPSPVLPCLPAYWRNSGRRRCSSCMPFVPTCMQGAGGIHCGGGGGTFHLPVPGRKNFCTCSGKRGAYVYTGRKNACACLLPHYALYYLLGLFCLPSGLPAVMMMGGLGGVPTFLPSCCSLHMFSFLEKVFIGRISVILPTMCLFWEGRKEEWKDTYVKTSPVYDGREGIPAYSIQWEEEIACQFREEEGRRRRGGKFLTCP